MKKSIYRKKQPKKRKKPINKNKKVIISNTIYSGKLPYENS